MGYNSGTKCTYKHFKFGDILHIEGGRDMKTAIIIMGAIVLILFVLLVTYGMSEPRLTDEEAEQMRKQLNEWQDRDNLEE